MCGVQDAKFFTTNRRRSTVNSAEKTCRNSVAFALGMESVGTDRKNPFAVGSAARAEFFNGVMFQTEQNEISKAKIESHLKYVNRLKNEEEERTPCAIDTTRYYHRVPMRRFASRLHSQ